MVFNIETKDSEGNITFKGTANATEANFLLTIGVNYLLSTGTTHMLSSMKKDGSISEMPAATQLQ